MSKKKLRYKRRKYRNHRGPNPTACDKHHLCFQRRCWRKGCLGELRLYWYCMVYIPKNTLHHEIHENVRGVPVPKEVNARFALEQLQALMRHGVIQEDDPIERRLKILATIFDKREPATAEAFRAQLEVVEKFYHHNPH